MTLRDRDIVAVSVASGKQQKRAFSKFCTNERQTPGLQRLSGAGRHRAAVMLPRNGSGQLDFGVEGFRGGGRQAHQHPQTERLQITKIESVFSEMHTY